jgi:hypothetical protein
MTQLLHRATVPRITNEDEGRRAPNRELDGSLNLRCGSFSVPCSKQLGTTEEGSLCAARTCPDRLRQAGGDARSRVRFCLRSTISPSVMSSTASSSPTTTRCGKRCSGPSNRALGEDLTPGREAWTVCYNEFADEMKRAAGA